MLLIINYIVSYLAYFIKCHIATALCLATFLRDSCFLVASYFSAASISLKLFLNAKNDLCACSYCPWVHCMYQFIDIAMQLGSSSCLTDDTHGTNEGRQEGLRQENQPLIFLRLWFLLHSWTFTFRFPFSQAKRFLHNMIYFQSMTSEHFR